MSQHDDPATVEASLRLGGGLQMGERAGIVAGWHRLDERLRSFRAGSVDLELTVKERDTPSQHTTLEAWIAGEHDSWPHRPTPISPRRSQRFATT